MSTTSATTDRFDARDIDREGALRYLGEHGYVVVENMLPREELTEIRDAVAEIFASERRSPFDPGDGPSAPGDDELNTYMAESYMVSEAERERVMRRIRHTRREHMGTPWPVGPKQMNKSFMHLPLMFDYDRSQRIMNVPAKLRQTPRLLEHPVMLGLARSMLGDDCVLSDLSATSIGPHTDEGGAWHIDAPLTQMPEPLPDIPLTVQNAWMLDDFTEHNGATRVLPKSHLLRKKPAWGYGSEEGEVILTAPAGSMAMWLSQTWHRSGPNATDRPRRRCWGTSAGPGSSPSPTTPGPFPGRSWRPTRPRRGTCWAGRPSPLSGARSLATFADTAPLPAESTGSVSISIMFCRKVKRGAQPCALTRRRPAR